MKAVFSEETAAGFPVLQGSVSWTAGEKNAYGHLL
jgi:hypothetical protein